MSYLGAAVWKFKYFAYFQLLRLVFVQFWSLVFFQFLIVEIFLLRDEYYGTSSRLIALPAP